MKITNSDYFNGFKLDPFKFHHNFSIVVAILDRTKPIHGEHSGLGVSSLPLDSAIRVRFPGVARGIAAPWPLGTA